MAVVLAVLTQKASAAEAAEAAGAVEAEVLDWSRRFIEAGKAGLRRGGRPEGRPGNPTAGPAPRSATDLAAENRALRALLREMRESTRLWRMAAQGTLVPLRDLEMIRKGAAMPISRFCDIVGVPYRYYFRHIAHMRSGENITGKRVAAQSAQLYAPIIVADTARRGTATTESMP